MSWVAVVGVVAVVVVLGLTAYVAQAPAIAVVGCSLVAAASLAASWAAVSRRR